MELQPVLDGPRLRLRPLKVADFDALYACANDPLIWALHPAKNRHEKAVFEAFFEQGLKSKGALAITRRETGEIIGTSRYYDLEGKTRVAIGFTFLTREHWGGDWNRELKFLMLDHAFKAVRSVIFHVGEGNLRSRRAMEKIGAKPAGRLERIKPDGSPDPTIIYEIKRPY